MRNKVERFATTFVAVVVGAVLGYVLTPDPTPQPVVQAPAAVTAEAPPVVPLTNTCEPPNCVNVDTGFTPPLVDAKPCPEYKVLSETEAWARMKR